VQADAKRAALQKGMDDAMADGVIDEDEQRAIDARQAQVRHLCQKRPTYMKRDLQKIDEDEQLAIDARQAQVRHLCQKRPTYMKRDLQKRPRS